MELKYDYDKFTLNDIIEGNKIVVPAFQRNVVWKDGKRKEFINTLRAGNPFGSILVYKENDKYILIDGLQRISTIKDFYNNPFKYFTYEDIDAELIMEIIKHDFLAKNISFSKNDSVVIKLCEEVQKYIFEEISNKIDWNDIMYDSLEKYGITNDRDISSFFSKLKDDFTAKLDIESLIVPTIVYKGPSEELSNVFFHLNTGGVNLSKYETLSASWGSEKYPVFEDDIIAKIYEKYKTLKESSDLDVDVTEEELKENGITVFEYCYAISELLRGKENKYDIILGKNKKSTDPVGFEILSLACGLNVNKADSLYSKVFKDAPAQFFIDLKNVIINTFDVLKQSLELWIKAINGEENTLDSTYMIYHMAISYIRNNYIIDIDNHTIQNKTNNEWNKKFRKNLYLYYFKDYISDYWKRNRQVADLMREIKSTDSLNKYTVTISENDWKKAFEAFKENQLQEVTSNISIKAKLFIDYLVKFKLKEKPEFKDKYFKMNIDYEHIIPQKRIEKQLTTAEKKTFPISSLGNICYLGYRDNRSKGKYTIYEYQEDRPTFVLNDEYLKLINYPTKEEIYFIDTNPEAFKVCYKDFIEKRIDSLNEEMIKYIKKQ